MAVEAKRGCGYRKIGGLYMVGGGIGVFCDRLPFELTVCSCCGQGIKQARGWTWVDVAKLFNGSHIEVFPKTPVEGVMPFRVPCRCDEAGLGCPLCLNPEGLGKAGLLWIGEKFYKTPNQFVKEGVELGFSRRISAVPQRFKIGETWVLLAHGKAVSKAVETHDADGAHFKMELVPGIFYVWLPQRIEKILPESLRGTIEHGKLEKRGITAVFVPDDDPDHRGNVHDDLDREKREENESE